MRVFNPSTQPPPPPYYASSLVTGVGVGGNGGRRWWAVRRAEFGRVDGACGFGMAWVGSNYSAPQQRVITPQCIVGGIQWHLDRGQLGGVFCFKRHATCTLYRTSFVRNVANHCWALGRSCQKFCDTNSSKSQRAHPTHVPAPSHRP